MRPTVLLVVGSAVACAGKPGYAPTIGNTAAPRARLACSNAVVAEIASGLRERWGETEDFLGVSCTAGAFPEPGYFISVTGPDRSRHRFGVLAADRTLAVAFESDPIISGTQIVQYVAADLDGDGADEIVETWRRDASGVLGSDEWVVVRRIVGDRLIEIEGPHLNVTFPNLGGCAATCELDRGALVVTVSNLPGIPPSDCLAPGRHTFELRGGELVGSRRRSCGGGSRCW